MKLVSLTVEGKFTAHYSEQGLVQLDFPGTERPHPCDVKAVPRARKWHVITTRALREILAGRHVTALPPLDLARGTGFQRRVWNALQHIIVGHTKSYAEVAAAIGNPKATRAVGGACGANPVPVLIPCHRVLAAKGKLGGFSSGLQWKLKLLAREGVQLC